MRHVYSPVREPYLVVDNQTKQSKWIDWNQFVDEGSFSAALRQKLIARGFNSSIGIVIDTSRNGWGGPNRPTQASTASDLNGRVDQSRVDRRVDAGKWCNQEGSGLGERPRANPDRNVHAYAWIKPPGESDGASSANATGYEPMCDPGYKPGDSWTWTTGALPNAPSYGAWFSAHFQELLANAYPPLPAAASRRR